MRWRTCVVTAILFASCAAEPLDVGQATGPRGSTRLVHAARDLDCADFADRDAARRALRSGDPDRLDADRDGVACERLAPRRPATRQPPRSVQP